MDLGSQWRFGFNGPTGLDYAALPAVFACRRIPRKQWPDLFDCIAIMERSALRSMKANQA
jgi:hypothetical protein